MEQPRVEREKAVYLWGGEAEMGATALTATALEQDEFSEGEHELNIERSVN